jgi:hypothetical protein
MRRREVDCEQWTKCCKQFEQMYGFLRKRSMELSEVGEWSFQHESRDGGWDWGAEIEGLTGHLPIVP